MNSSGASPGGAASLAAKPPQSDLVDAVRHWVHFDNLAETLTKQVGNARTMRNTYEDKVLQSLDIQNMRNAEIKISGATLQRQSKYKQTDLSWGLLEEQLHDYYKVHNRSDETAKILEHIQKNRGGKTVEYLKKTLTSESIGKKNPQ